MSKDDKRPTYKYEDVPRQHYCQGLWKDGFSQDCDAKQHTVHLGRERKPT